MPRGAATLSTFLLVVCVQASGCRNVTNHVPGPFKDAAFKEIEPGLYQLGSVKIDQRRHTVSFPAVLNLSGGAMEYFLVSSWGKVHESILRTDTEPYHIHAAMLLLGAQGIGTNEQQIAAALGPFISHPSSAVLPGDKISVELRWTAEGKAKRKRAEELIWNNTTKSSLPKSRWVYNGSILDDQSFAAQREGSIISLVTDPEALINNTAQGHENDTIWSANPTNLPPSGISVEVIVNLIKSARQRSL